MTDVRHPPRRLGMLTPSSNTVLEPMTAAMLADLPETTAHFARFTVREISLDPAALGQFELEPMLLAAEQLADAKVDAICWNGTAAGWRGFDADRALCEAIERRTGVAACSAVLALNEILALAGVRRVALVTPYLAEIQTRIIEVYQAAGFEVVAERHLEDRGNFSFATYEEPQIAALCREVAAAGPDAILIYCTNFRGARVAPEIEAETGILACDTVATALWGALRQAGASPARVRGWGRLFDLAG